ncbi:MAG: tetratricopeptide repeat protein [Bacteroidota bacterium]
MTTSRLERLLEFYKEDPQDPFNLYALALEFQKSDPNRSLECFEKLLAEHENYLPTYYHAGKFFQELDQKERALEIFQKGIALGKEQKNMQATRELQAAYQELMFE